MFHRRPLSLCALLCLLAAGLLLPACRQARPAVANPFPVHVREYSSLYQATLQVLREEGLAVAHENYRRGEVVSHPEPAPILFEVWARGNSTLHQAAESTLNAQRRVVSVSLEPAAGTPGWAGGEMGRQGDGETGKQGDTETGRQGDAETAESPRPPLSASPRPVVPPGIPGTSGSLAQPAEDYLLRVEAMVERRQRPTRRLTGAVTTRHLLSRLDRLPAEWARRGITEDYWMPVARDPHLEQRLLRAIVERSLQLPARP